MKKFIIWFQTQEMGRIVERYLLSRNFQWCGLAPKATRPYEFLNNIETGKNFSIGNFFCGQVNNIAAELYTGYTQSNGAAKDVFNFQAETEFGEFIKFINDGLTRPPVKLALNSEYKAEVSDNGVTVGCQTFSHEIVLKLAELVKARSK